MCPLWPQHPFWSHPQGGKGEQGPPGPSGLKGEKGARVSAPAVPGGGLGCEPSSPSSHWEPAAWPK